MKKFSKISQSERKIAIALQKGYILGKDPDFITDAIKLRQEFDLPNAGIKDPVKLIKWEEQHPEFDNAHFHERIREIFLASSKYRLGANAEPFIVSYIYTGVMNATGFPLPTVEERVDKYGQAEYVMIYYNHSTKDDVVNAYLQFQKNLKKRGKLSKQQKRERLIGDAVLQHAYRAIELRENSHPTLPYSEIADQINKEFPDLDVVYDHDTIKKLVRYYKPMLRIRDQK